MGKLREMVQLSSYSRTNIDIELHKKNELRIQEEERKFFEARMRVETERKRIETEE